MYQKYITPILLPLLACSVAHADINLVAIGSIDAGLRDLSARTAAPLENGAAGNISGGISSGLAYAGGNTFLGLPDRGPNASAYNTAIDNTTSYIPRFHSISLDLVKNPDFNALTTGSMPYLLSSHITSTTLLSSSNLVYASAGAPALNNGTNMYFSGRSDNFKTGKSSTNPGDARLDPEGIRVSNDGLYIYITDEYGPYVYKFIRGSGKRISAFTLPGHFAVANKAAFEKGTTGEIALNTSGRTTNKGMEGLAITPDGNFLVGIMQANLIQDTSKYVRIAKIDTVTKAVKEYAYQLTDGSGVSEILAINNDKFLVLERDGKGLGDNSNALVKKLFLIDLSTATEVTGAATIGVGSPVVGKSLFLDIVAELTAAGINPADIPSKMEGIAFGPDMVIEGVTKHTLMLGNDNDFLPTITDSNHPDGINNPNQFYVFTMDSSDVPDYVPQPLVVNPLDKRDRG